jgi:hypothetical protein
MARSVKRSKLDAYDSLASASALYPLLPPGLCRLPWPVCYEHKAAIF